MNTWGYEAKQTELGPVCPHYGADQHEIQRDIIQPLRDRIATVEMVYRTIRNRYTDMLDTLYNTGQPFTFIENMNRDGGITHE